MDVDDVNTVEEGKRVLVSASPNVEQIHESAQLSWIPSLHTSWQDKVGYVARLHPETDSATVKFYEWDVRPPQMNVKRLVEVEVIYHYRALQLVKKLHFLDGDRPVLIRSNKNRGRYYQLVSLRLLPYSDEPVYSLKSTKGAPFDWSQRRYPNDFLLPVYIGRNKHTVLREKYGAEGVDITAGRVLYGTLDCPFGAEVMHSLRTWPAHDGDLFRLALSRFPDQVNVPIDGRTPLMVAVEESIWPAVVILIAFGAHREVVDDKNNTLLHLAAAKGDVRVLEGMLGFLEKDINKVNILGDTALHLATRGLHAACVDRLLCVSNIHSNIINCMGETVLHVICSVPESSSSLTILSRILGNQRLNPSMINHNGWTSVHLAVMRGNAKCVELMIQSRSSLIHNSMPPPLVFAAMHGKNKVVDIILALKQDFAVELQTLPDGKTSLHVAVDIWHGDVESDVARLACVQSLVTSGVPVSAMDHQGQTACHLLVKYINGNPKELDRMTLANAIQCQKATMKLDEMAAKLRPHWQLACLCFLTARGCDLSILDIHGRSAIDLCIDDKLRDTLNIMVQNRLKCCLPMAVPANEFDTSDVHMCTFNCEDSVADVEFIPCGHRVICKQCATVTPLRRCPMCYGNVTSAVDLHGKPVEIGSALKSKQPDPVEMAKMAEELARKVKEEAEKEKRKEIDALREAYEKLEMETSCAICLDARPSVVFNCGHTSCAECCESIQLCHICRQPIKQKMTIYT